MKLKLTIAALAATTMGANAAAILVDNYIGEPNGATGGAVANFAVQSFTPNVPGLGATDTVAANSPLPTTVYLDSATFLKAVTGVATAGPLFLNVYQGNDGNDGTFLGSSTNTVDVGSAAGLDSLIWSFGNIALNSTLETALVWSTTATDDSAVNARIAVARDASGGFGDSYTAGTADNDGNNDSPSSFDARFAVSLNTVPEPSSTAFLGLGGLALILRRRRK
ncbi:MAG: hypothetical protein ACI9UA_002171 [Pseudoalteromonas tetraodonis]|jgi:hypothetical protein